MQITLRSGKEMQDPLPRIRSKINGPHNQDEQLLYEGLTRHNLQQLGCLKN